MKEGFEYFDEITLRLPVKFLATSNSLWTVPNSIALQLGGIMQENSEVD